jgi:hypothetical protein
LVVPMVSAQVRPGPAASDAVRTQYGPVRPPSCGLPCLRAACAPRRQVVSVGRLVACDSIAAASNEELIASAEAVLDHTGWRSAVRGRGIDAWSPAGATGTARSHRHCLGHGVLRRAQCHRFMVTAREYWIVNSVAVCGTTNVCCMCCNRVGGAGSSSAWPT